MRGDEVPYEARRNTIRTYEGFHQKFDAFLSGQIESNLLIVARWGIGKSFYLKQHADREITAIMEGNLRPLKTYMELYKHRNKLIILDDAETLWNDKPGRIIIRELTETSFPKTISWTSTVKPLEEHGVPISFQTNSRTCIICNAFRFGRTDETAAIVDRCQCYYFDPTNEEVARYVAKWFWDQAVFDYALKYLHEIDKLTARMFVKASERRTLGDRKWKNEFPLLSGGEFIAKKIILDPRFKTSTDRLDEFKKLTAELPEQDGKSMSRASFIRYQADLKARRQLSTLPPKLRLKVKGERRAVPVGVDAIKADIQRAQQEDKERLAINNDKEEDEEFDGHSLELSFGET